MRRGYKVGGRVLAGWAGKGQMGGRKDALGGLLAGSCRVGNGWELGACKFHEERGGGSWDVTG